MRVVVKNSADGKKTAMKRRTTKSYTFCSASLKPEGACNVGMIAKWSLTFLLSNTRGNLRTYDFSIANAACGAKCAMPLLASMAKVS